MKLQQYQESVTEQVTRNVSIMRQTALMLALAGLVISLLVKWGLALELFSMVMWVCIFISLGIICLSQIYYNLNRFKRIISAQSFINIHERNARNIVLGTQALLSTLQLVSLLEAVLFAARFLISVIILI